MRWAVRQFENESVLFRESERFGLGIWLFVLASVVSALAPNPIFLICARAVQGAGAALMVPGSLAIIAKAEAAPKEEPRRPLTRS